MPTSLRQQIVDALLARLRTIKPSANPPYETNVGDQAHEWRDLEKQPWTPDEITEGALNIKDKSEPAQNDSIVSRHLKELQIEVEIATSKTAGSDPSVSQQVRKIIADIEKSLQGFVTWAAPVKIQDISPLSVNDMDVKHGGESIVGGARLEFSVKYSTQRHNPYTQ